MKREPKTFRSIDKGSIIYVAYSIDNRKYKIVKKPVYCIHKTKTKYGQRNTIFFGMNDYFYASPNNTLEYSCDTRYCPNLNYLINHLKSIGCDYEY